MIASLILILVINGIIFFYLTRPHVKRYFEVGKSKGIISIIKKNKKIIAILIFLIIIVSLVIIWGLTPTGEIKILSVKHTPENPQPGDKIKIIAEITGGSPFLGANPSCSYECYFGSSMGGSTTMSSVGDNKYTLTLNPTFSYFSEGTEIWYIIKGGNDISDSYTIQIGYVERSNISTLSITNVTQNPENPTTETKTVIITADIRSNVSIEEVIILYNIFIPPHGSGGGSNGGFKSSINDFYSFRISLTPEHILSSNEDQYYPKGTKVFYKIVTKDKLGNTAVTSIDSFTIN